MTVSVRHDQYKDAWDTSVTAKFPVGDKEEEVRYFHTYKRGVDRVFVDHPYFLAKVWGKTNGKLYGPVAGKDYEDNQLRFSLFAQAAIEAARVLNLNNGTTGSGPYGEDVIFVANDWHTALVPCYLKAYYKSRGLFKNAKVAFCIHNMAYQGRFPPEDFDRLNLPESFRSSFAFLDGYDYPVKGWKINWMKAAITESDILITVSPNYAKELTAGEDTGVELNKEVEKKGVIGITNGMDVQEWDPSTDKFLEVNYDVTTAKAAKEILRQNLRSLVGLEDKQCPILGFVGRLEEQKGSDILAAAVPEILKHDVQMVILGTGKKTLEAELKDLEARFPGKVSAVCKFDSALAHLIIAAVHFMVIPSRFEPCGLNQLYAMRYGTPPIAPPVGGLVDTIKHGVTGFLTSQPFNIDCDAVDPSDVKSLSATIEDALQICETPSYFEMMETCMGQDLSWKEPAKKWEEILLSLNVEGSKPGTDGDEIAPLAKENVATP
ncbi:hypothetical protein KP509_19G049200 [Ceratopteris richardii]|nr:hypothetical protein KP509_19G049200 [Ceratopteris richardii]